MQEFLLHNLFTWTFRKSLILVVPYEWKVVTNVSLKQKDSEEGTGFMTTQGPYHANTLSFQCQEDSQAFLPHAIHIFVPLLF